MRSQILARLIALLGRVLQTILLTKAPPQPVQARLPAPNRRRG